MKNKIFKTILSLTLLSFVAISCVKEDDFEIPTLKTPFFSEDFQNLDEIQHNTILNLPGWTNWAEEGSVLWYERIYDGDGYAQFNPYGTTSTSAITWLVSPAINITGKSNIKLSFQTAQNFVSDDSNTIEVYVSSDFDGTNVSAATWTQLNATIANKDSEGYAFIPSGEIDLSAFEGNENIFIGFRAIGSGTNTALDGLFQINNVYVYTAN